MTSLVAFMDDLMFLTRIREAARAAGVAVQAARDPAGLVEACRLRRPAVVFVDLESTRLDALTAIAAVKADPRLASVPVVGFLGQAHAERARAAERAGCTRILTRGAFVNELRTLILQPPGARAGGKAPAAEPTK